MQVPAECLASVSENIYLRHETNYQPSPHIAHLQIHVSHTSALYFTFNTNFQAN